MSKYICIKFNKNRVTIHIEKVEIKNSIDEYENMSQLEKNNYYIKEFNENSDKEFVLILSNNLTSIDIYSIEECKKLLNRQYTNTDLDNVKILINKLIEEKHFISDVTTLQLHKLGTSFYILNILENNKFILKFTESTCKLFIE